MDCNGCFEDKRMPLNSCNFGRGMQLGRRRQRTTIQLPGVRLVVWLMNVVDGIDVVRRRQIVKSLTGIREL